MIRSKPLQIAEIHCYIAAAVLYYSIGESVESAFPLFYRLYSGGRGDGTHDKKRRKLRYSGGDTHNKKHERGRHP